MHTIYVEQAIQHHPRVKTILARYPTARVIDCTHYGEVFNRQAQNFRLQKSKPALILASKRGRRVLPAPAGFGIGSHQNYYFSHILNCLYDCRYCFLQGMYPSANYVWFVNYEDFMTDIAALYQEKIDQALYFFSGYDGDSLALEGLTDFVKHFVPFFQSCPQAILELRTKSAAIKPLLDLAVLSNVVVAFSFTPQAISTALERKVPSVERRIAAMAQLAARGWRLGLRLDPLIYVDNFNALYEELLATIFARVPSAAIHSVSLGPLRFPFNMYTRIKKLYPTEPLYALPMRQRDKQVSYPAEQEAMMKQTVLQQLSHYVPATKVFQCQAGSI